jgi:hypothetical protein
VESYKNPSSGGGGAINVAGKTGDVTLTASDISNAVASSKPLLNTNYGNSSATFCEGNDSRLS